MLPINRLFYFESISKYGKRGLLVASLASFTHLILDRMWQNPVVLWWPLLGRVKAEETAGWLAGIAKEAFSYPDTYIPEIIGLIIILLTGYRLLRKKQATNFLRTGAIR